jgi:hypothetical protein
MFNINEEKQEGKQVEFSVSEKSERKRKENRENQVSGSTQKKVKILNRSDEQIFVVFEDGRMIEFLPRKEKEISDEDFQDMLKNDVFSFYTGKLIIVQQ